MGAERETSVPEMATAAASTDSLCPPHPHVPCVTTKVLVPEDFVQLVGTLGSATLSLITAPSSLAVLKNSPAEVMSEC